MYWRQKIGNFYYLNHRILKGGLFSARQVPPLQFFSNANNANVKALILVLGLAAAHCKGGRVPQDDPSTWGAAQSYYKILQNLAKEGVIRCDAYGESRSCRTENIKDNFAASLERLPEGAKGVLFEYSYPYDKKQRVLIQTAMEGDVIGNNTRNNNANDQAHKNVPDQSQKNTPETPKIPKIKKRSYHQVKVAMVLVGEGDPNYLCVLPVIPAVLPTEKATPPEKFQTYEEVIGEQMEYLAKCENPVGQVWLYYEFKPALRRWAQEVHPSEPGAAAISAIVSTEEAGCYKISLTPALQEKKPKENGFKPVFVRSLPCG